MVLSRYLSGCPIICTSPACRQAGLAGNNNLQKIQNSFIKHTSKEFKKLLAIDNNLQAYEVNAIDRKYNFWQRDSLNIELFTAAVFQQKLNYIPARPVRRALQSC